MTSEFWRPRLITQRKVLVPFAFEKTEPGVAHLQAAANFLAGKKVEGQVSFISPVVDQASGLRRIRAIFNTTDGLVSPELAATLHTAD